MLAALVVSLICNVLLLIFAAGFFYDGKMFKEFWHDRRDECEKLEDDNSRLQTIVDIQAKRLIDIRKLTQT